MADKRKVPYVKLLQGLDAIANWLRQARQLSGSRLLMQTLKSSTNQLLLVFQIQLRKLLGGVKIERRTTRRRVATSWCLSHMRCVGLVSAKQEVKHARETSRKITTMTWLYESIEFSRERGF